MHFFLKLLKPVIDFFATFFMWLYFTIGFIFVFLPILITLTFSIRDREEKFQKANYYFYRIFFLLIKMLSPGLSINIDENVKQIKSAVVISNHTSYLDPISLISIFPKHKTIVKGIFFKIPVLSWVMKSEGFICYTPNNSYDNSIMDRMKNILDFSGKGGNLFIFPEGKRSRDGHLGKLQKGAFSIAKKYNLPIQVIYTANTGRLFTPGKLLLNTCIKNIVSVEKLGTIEPLNKTVSEMKEIAVSLFENRMKKIN
jgi:1-acyl-sn-glycerol-3-phosphate acyltransferase